MTTEFTPTVPPEAAPPTIHPDIILRAEKITKAYPGTMALKGVDFNVYQPVRRQLHGGLRTR